MKGRCCSVCLSPARQAVDDALMGGGKLVPVAKQFGLSKSAVARHKTGCLAPKLAAAARVVSPAKEIRQETRRAREIAAGQAVPTLAEITSLTGLLDRLARSLDRLESAADGAAADNAYASLAALSSQLHRGVEAAGRLQGIGVAQAQSAGRPGFVLNINVTQPPPTLPHPVPVVRAATAEPHTAEEPDGAGIAGFEPPPFRITFDKFDPEETPATPVSYG